MKQCKVCPNYFKQYKSTELVCSPKCALELVKAKKAKAYAQETTRLKREHRGSDKRHQLKLAQASFNSFIRERDPQSGGCISCGSTTGKWTAGHFKTDKALRFHEDNCHGQCWWNCNSNKSGNISAYRPRLVEKIGTERVEYLEQDHPSPKYSLDDIIEIKLLYRAKLKALK